MERLTTLFSKWSGGAPATVTRLAGAGSNRAYYRLSGSQGLTAIGCVGTSREENHAFITLARHFHAKGLPVPEVYAVSDDEMCYLQQDLGGTSLFDMLRQGREAGGRYDETERELLRQTVRLLPRIQFVGGQGLDFSVCYPQPAFDQTSVMFDLNYFKYCFLKPVGVDFHELRLEQDFRRMADDLTQEESTTFMYRDFQARNIMVGTAPQGPPAPPPTPPAGGRGVVTLKAEEQRQNYILPSPPREGSGVGLFCIDFQGGRRGPVYYDLASFLWQASARYPDELRSELLDVYYAEAQNYGALPQRETFDERLRIFVLFRLLQVLGAYGFRGYFERKQHFIDSIPPALDSLHRLITNHRFNYPHLTEVLEELTTHHPTLHPSPSTLHPSPSTLHPSPSTLHPKLVVRIYSFSYKKGIPQDESGNGGGYVFDCRGTHNPGRYEQYKHLTGLDEPVKKFLEDDGEILTFLDSVYRMADVHVQRYIERGFTSLMFCFGCTGGQHRSVYSAQHLAEHLHRRFPQVEVRLCHREQGISTVYE